MSVADGGELVPELPQDRPEPEHENISTGHWVEVELFEPAAGLVQVSTVKPQLVLQPVAMGETHTG